MHDDDLVNFKTRTTFHVIVEQQAGKSMCAPVIKCLPLRRKPPDGERGLVVGDSPIHFLLDVSLRYSGVYGYSH